LVSPFELLGIKPENIITINRILQLQSIFPIFGVILGDFKKYFQKSALNLLTSEAK